MKSWALCLLSDSCGPHIEFTRSTVESDPIHKGPPVLAILIPPWTEQWLSRLILQHSWWAIKRYNMGGLGDTGVPHEIYGRNENVASSLRSKKEKYKLSWSLLTFVLQKLYKPNCIISILLISYLSDQARFLAQDHGPKKFRPMGRWASTVRLTGPTNFFSLQSGQHYGGYCCLAALCVPKLKH